MNKYKDKFVAWIEGLVTSAVIKGLKTAPLEERIGIAIEALRYDYLPHGACWMCSMPVSRKGGYHMWRGKMFCTEICLNKYTDITQHPTESYKVLHGDAVEVFAPK